MAAFPTLTHDISSRRIPASGIALDRAEDGTLRSRTLYATTTYDFELLLPNLSTADKDSVLSHYASNVNSTFSYTWPAGSVAHTVVYADYPEVIGLPNGRHDVRVRLAGAAT
jgi:hypothetical protein